MIPIISTVVSLSTACIVYIQLQLLLSGSSRSKTFYLTVLCENKIRKKKIIRFDKYINIFLLFPHFFYIIPQTSLSR